MKCMYLFQPFIIIIGIVRFPMLINTYAAYSDWFVLILFTEKHRQETSGLTNRSAIEICTTLYM